MVGLVGHSDVFRRFVRVAIDRDGRDSQIRTGLDDPNGDLPTVGDQNVFKHNTKL